MSKYMGQIMAECDCQHQACEMRGYCMAARIEQLAATNKELETQNTDAMREAKGLAKALHRRFYQEQAPQWEPLEDVAGIISQIDNMTAGMADRIEELELAVRYEADLAQQALDARKELAAKLAKAVKALEFYGGWSDHSGGICGFDGGSRARTTLAELRGQDDE